MHQTRRAAQAASKRSQAVRRQAKKLHVATCRKGMVQKPAHLKSRGSRWPRGAHFAWVNSRWNEWKGRHRYSAKEEQERARNKLWADWLSMSEDERAKAIGRLDEEASPEDDDADNPDLTTSSIRSDAFAPWRLHDGAHGMFAVVLRIYRVTASRFQSTLVLPRVLCSSTNSIVPGGGLHSLDGLLQLLVTLWGYYWLRSSESSFAPKHKSVTGFRAQPC